MSQTKSRYATKRDSGQMMYGPGCCAHTVTDAQIAAAKRNARERLEREEKAARAIKFWRGLDADCVFPA